MKQQSSFSLKSLTTNKNKLAALIIAVAIGITGLALIITRASGFFSILEGEQGTLSGTAAIVNDTSASGGKALQFGSGVITPPAPTPTATVSVNGATKYQTIDGFGATANSLAWSNGQTKPALDQLTASGVYLWRVVLDETDWESTNDNSDPNNINWAYYNSVYGGSKFANLWGTIGYLNQKNTEVMVNFMGELPGWMGGATLNTSAEDEFVEMIATMAYYGRVTKGLDFKLLSPMNEEDWGHGEGPLLPSAQYVRVMQKLSVKLDSLGLNDIKFVGPDTASVNSGIKDYMPAMRGNSTVLSKLAHYGLHDYSGNAGGAYGSISSKTPFINYWMTEFSAPCSGCDTGAPNPANWSFAKQMFEYAGGFMDQRASALFAYDAYDSYYNHHGSMGYWGLMALNQTNNTYSPRKSMYSLAQLYKFVPAGSQMVATTSSKSGLTVRTFVHPASGVVTLVGENSTGSTQVIGGTLQNTPAVNSLQYYQTNATSNLDHGANVAVSAGSFTASVPNDTIFTLTTAP